ncbi:hypothetical protein BSPWISOXPB_4936 [uncultured Gammaproteobacteria bacterium]|nr:hypothetical protein BSPWISOXPB_4936 [uncultured Gammaproteobacteria bacterium]
MRGYVVDVYFCVFDVSVEEFVLDLDLELDLELDLDWNWNWKLFGHVGYLDIATA